MKKQIKLTENDLHRMIKESVYRVLNEGRTDTTDMDAWENCKEMVGADTMLGELEKWLDSDSYHQFLEHMDRYYELGLFGDGEDEDYDGEEGDY